MSLGNRFGALRGFFARVYARLASPSGAEISGAPQSETIWESKFVLLTARAISMGLGLLRIVVSVRLVSVHDYALIGIADSWRVSIVSLTSLGVAESLVREGSATTSRSEIGQHLATSYIWGVLLTVVSIAITLGVAAQSHQFSSDPRLPIILMLTILVSMFERMNGYAISILRALRKIRLFVQLQVAQAFVVLVLTAALTFKFNVVGYFNAVWITSLLLQIVLQTVIQREVRMPGIREAFAGFVTSSRSLWSISWYVYWFKNIYSAWDRVPFIVASTILPQQVMGFLAIALDLARRINIVNQAIFVTTIARLTNTFSKHARHFRRLAIAEVREILTFNIVAMTLMYAGFIAAGSLILGAARYDEILVPFLVFLPAQVCYAIAGIGLNAILIPAKLLSVRLLVSMTAAVLAAVAATYFGSGSEILGTLALPLSMLVSGLVVACVMVACSYGILRQVHDMAMADKAND